MKFLLFFITLFLSPLAAQAACKLSLITSFEQVSTQHLVAGKFTPLGVYAHPDDPLEDSEQALAKASKKALIASFLGCSILLFTYILFFGIATPLFFGIFAAGAVLSMYGFVNAIRLRRKYRRKSFYPTYKSRLGWSLFLGGLFCVPAVIVGVTLSILLYFQPFLGF